MILRPDQIRTALSATEKEIRLLDSRGSFVAVISLQDAAFLLSRGHYKVGGTKNRVKYLRENGRCIRPRTFFIDHSHWDGRGVIRFFADMRSKGGHEAAA